MLLHCVAAQSIAEFSPPYGLFVVLLIKTVFVSRERMVLCSPNSMDLLWVGVSHFVLVGRKATSSSRTRAVGLYYIGIRMHSTFRCSTAAAAPHLGENQISEERSCVHDRGETYSSEFEVLSTGVNLEFG